MGAVNVKNIESLLPGSLKLDQSNFNSTIPGFSEKTMEVFSTVNPGKDTTDLSNAHQKMKNDVSLLQNWQKRVHGMQKYENLFKILSIVALAAAIGLTVAGIVGVVIAPSSIMLLFALAFGAAGVIGAGTAFGFACTNVPCQKKQLSKFSTDDIKNYQTTLQKYIVMHEDTLRQEIGNKIADLKTKAQGQNDDVKAAIDEDIDAQEKALKELDALLKHYRESAEKDYVVLESLATASE